jgi:hypothetical protein
MTETWEAFALWMSGAAWMAFCGLMGGIVIGYRMGARASRR